MMAKPKKKYSELSKREISQIKKILGITKIQDIDTKILKQLREEIKKLKDIRQQGKIIYKFWDVIICVIIASFANNNTWNQIAKFIEDNYNWFKSFLQMTGGIPSPDTIERIIGLIDDEELNEILLDFFKSIVIKKLNGTILTSFDGRVNNGSKRNLTISNDAKKPLNCLNAYSNEYGYCIATVPIDSKTNEIPTIENLIKGMNLKGVIATWDALNSQIKNVKAVVGAGGDYVIPIKANQGNFYNDLILYFDDKRCDEIKAGNSHSEYLTYNEKSHGAIIKYECFQTSDINWYDNLSDWEKVNSFGLVKKTITRKELVKSTRKNAKNKDKKIEKEVTTIECRYYISSKTVNIKEFNLATRGHWNVENKVHWHLDFTFCQDKNSTTNKKALLNLEIIHKFILAILERVKDRYKMSLKDIRIHLGNNISEFFPELLCYLILNSR